MDANKSQFLIMQTLFKMYRYRHRPFPSFQQWSDPEPPRWRKFAECAEERDWDAFGSTAGRKRPDINIEIFFVSANNQRLRQTTPPGWEAYLRWRLLHAAKIPFEYMYMGLVMKMKTVTIKWARQGCSKAATGTGVGWGPCQYRYRQN